VKKRVGYLPETPPLYNELLVSEYLAFVADLRRIPKSEKKTKIDRAIEKCQLGDVRKRLIAHLSKGYRQRVGIAQAIIHDPEIVILDEPTIGLDPKQVSEARGLIKSMKTERTLIYSTHILSEVAATCDRIIVIDKGKIVAQEAIGEIQASGLIKVEIVVRSMNDEVVSRLKEVRGVRSVNTITNGTNRLIVEMESGDELMAEISKTVVNQNVGLVRMSPVKLSLEEYYLDLIGGRRATV
jgi:ABC-2 type transport system ATP-binding protein